MTILCIALGTLALVCAIGWYDTACRLRDAKADTKLDAGCEFDSAPRDRA